MYKFISRLTELEQHMPNFTDQGFMKSFTFSIKNQMSNCESKLHAAFKVTNIKCNINKQLKNKVIAKVMVQATESFTTRDRLPSAVL